MTLSPLVTAVGNTLLAILLCIAIAIPASTIAAVLLCRSNVVGRRWAVLALLSQLAVPLYVFAGGWSAGVGLQGWMRIAEWLGPTGVEWMQGWLGSLLAVAAIHALAAIPWCFLILSMGLLCSDRSEEESALLENGWHALVRFVWLPRLRIWIAVACLWCALGLLTEMVVSNLYMFSTVAELIYLDVSRYSTTPLTYLAAAILCSLPLLAVGLAVARRLPNLQWILVKPLHFDSTPLSLGRWRATVSILLWSGLAIIVGLPMFNLLIKAGWTPHADPDGNVGYGWSSNRFLQTAYESITLFQSEYYWSLLLGVSSTTVALVLSISLYWLSRSRRPAMEESHRWSRSGIHIAMLLLISIPGPLAGMLITESMNRPSPAWLGQLYTATLTAPVIAQQFRLLPCSWLIVCAIMASIPRRCWELAHLDGLTSFGVLRTVVWPQTKTHWLALGVLLMLLSIGELSCSIGVLPPGVTTTSMRLFEILHFGMRHQDSAICGILILFGWLTAGIVMWSADYSRTR